jgi:hypothetical protein
MSVVRVTGLPDGGIDLDKQEVHFELSTGEGRKAFNANYGVGAQVMGALTRMVSELKRHLDQRVTGMAATGAEVAAAHVQKDRWPDVVLLQLTTPAGTYVCAPAPRCSRYRSSVANRKRKIQSRR